MANQSTITLAVGVVGPGLSSTYAPPAQVPMVNANAPGAVPETIQLNAGNNTITFPPGMQTMILYPAASTPAPNTNAKTVGGLSIHPAFPFMWCPVVGATSVVINAVAGEQVQIAFC
jgi:hypothetical protein